MDQTQGPVDYHRQKLLSSWPDVKAAETQALRQAKERLEKATRRRNLMEHVAMASSNPVFRVILEEITRLRESELRTLVAAVDEAEMRQAQGAVRAYDSILAYVDHAKQAAKDLDMEAKAAQAALDRNFRADGRPIINKVVPT